MTGVGGLADRKNLAEIAIILEALPARCGDCFLVSCQRPDSTWRLLVDTGPDETWPVLRNRLSNIPLNEEGRRTLDLVIVSHIDHDHIGSAPFLFSDETLGLSFGDVWFNGRHHLERGVAEGETLSELLSARDRQLPWNKAFDGGAVVTPGEGQFVEVPRQPGEPCITLLSPTPKQLTRLATVWDNELQKLRSCESNTRDDLERGSKFPDLEALAALSSRLDSTPPNGSSIAILLEHRGVSLLLAADAFPIDLSTALLGVIEHRGISHPHCVNVFKLSHHGSRANIVSELLGVVRAEDYVVSTNGRYGHPSDEALARVVLYGGEEPTLWFNHITKRNQRWADPVLQTKYKFHTHFPKDPADGVTLLCRPRAAGRSDDKDDRTEV